MFEFNRNPNVMTGLYLSFTICFKIKSNKKEDTYCATRTHLIGRPNVYFDRIVLLLCFKSKSNKRKVTYCSTSCL